MGFFKNVGATLPIYEISDVMGGWVRPSIGETFLLNVLGKKVPAQMTRNDDENVCIKSEELINLIKNKEKEYGVL